jgi:O-methyltransferase involved in polyketide biosynthesis
MRAGEASATARLIAESTIFLAGDGATGHLVPARAAELSASFVESPSRLARWALQSGLKRRLARSLITRFERLILPGIQLHYALRKRYLEDAALAALAAGVRQLVIFGAGFDTLALRLAASFPAAEFFELDHPATQAAKTRALAARHAHALTARTAHAPNTRTTHDPDARTAHELDARTAHNLDTRTACETDARDARTPRNLHFVPLDLTRRRITDALLRPSSGYRADLQTLFVAEGLTMYLARGEVESLFAFARTHAARGSLFAFTFFEPRDDGRLGFRASSPLVEAWLRWRGEAFKWGARRDELIRLLAAYDFEPREIVATEILRRRYLAPARLAHLRLAEGESVCLARLI